MKENIDLLDSKLKESGFVKSVLMENIKFKREIDKFTNSIRKLKKGHNDHKLDDTSIQKLADSDDSNEIEKTARFSPFSFKHGVYDMTLFDIVELFLDLQFKAKEEDSPEEYFNEKCDFFGLDDKFKHLFLNTFNKK